MRKKDLAVRLSQEFDLPKKLSADLLDYVFDQIVLAAVTNDSYHHPGFGCFIVAERKQRVIHNVNSRTLMKIPKKKMLRLVPSRRLSKKLNKKPVKKAAKTKRAKKA